MNPVPVFRVRRLERGRRERRLHRRHLGRPTAFRAVPDHVDGLRVPGPARFRPVPGAPPGDRFRVDRVRPPRVVVLQRRAVGAAGDGPRRERRGRPRVPEAVPSRLPERNDQEPLGRGDDRPIGAVHRQTAGAQVRRGRAVPGRRDAGARNPSLYRSRHTGKARLQPCNEYFYFVFKIFSFDRIGKYLFIFEYYLYMFEYFRKINSE